jgi:preprotein translocase subunit YajC
MHESFFMSQSIFAFQTLAQQASSTTSQPAVNAVGVPGAPASTATGPALPASTGTVPATGTAAPGTPAPASPMSGLSLLLPFVVIMGLMFFMSARTTKKEKKKREELMASIGRGDKVQLAGGIIGTVSDLYDTELVIKLEEGRMRVARASVTAVLTSKGGAGGTSAKSVLEAKEPSKVAV